MEVTKKTKIHFSMSLAVARTLSPPSIACLLLIVRAKRRQNERGEERRGREEERDRGKMLPSFTPQENNQVRLGGHELPVDERLPIKYIPKLAPAIYRQNIVGEEVF